MIRRLMAAGIAVLLLAAPPVSAQSQPTLEQLLAPGPLPEKSFGAVDAPVTVIEYASLTCGHCRNFHVNVWPAFKEQYVDTGKVRFIMREFPFDPRALAGFMLARCAGEDKWYPTIDLLYRAQERWSHVADATSALKLLVGMAGLDGAEVEQCLSDQALRQKISAVAETGKSFGVDSTPTFFINSQMHKGVLQLPQLSEIIDPLVAGGQ